MKYVLIDDRGSDLFTDEFENKEDAIKAGKLEWEKYLTDSEKKECKAFFVLESANPDEEAENHFDGNPVEVWK